MAVPEQEKEKSRMSNSKVLHARMFFENWEFVLANCISYGCSEQEKEKSRMPNSKVLHFLFVLEA
jgi:hypothetical protein